MRVIGTLVACVVLVSCGNATPTEQAISASGVRIVAPAGWQRVTAADPGPVIDPRTLFVVGTEGVRPKSSRCQIASYRLPPSGAVVVIIRWANLALSGASWERAGRQPLKELTRVRGPSFECFSGRGAVADVRLAGRTYQVNVMVGDAARKNRVSEALAVARSFDLVH